MDSEQTLELLSTVRHEWMNRLQLISLYAALEPTKLEELYDRYRRQADEESALVRLNLPQTSLVVIQANWGGRMTYTISTDQLVIDDERVADQLTRLLKSTTEPIHVTFTDGLTVRVTEEVPEGVFTSEDVYEQGVASTTFYIKEGK